MANSWLRLWHDMPTDPKFGTVARVSGEQISLVLSVYLHLMVDASRNVTRGHVTVTAEDLATALNVTDEQIEKILAAMNGRLIVDGALSGWDKRQVKREDSGDDETGAKSAAQRKAEQREREKQASIDAANLIAQQQGHDTSRNVTLDKTRLDKKKKGAKAPMSADKLPPWMVSLIGIYHEVLPDLPGVRVMDQARSQALRDFWDWVLTSTRPDGSRRANNEEEALSWVRDYMNRARSNDFIMGRGPKSPEHQSWVCSIEYLLSSRGMKKVLEETRVIHEPA